MEPLQKVLAVQRGSQQRTSLKIFFKNISPHPRPGELGDGRASSAFSDSVLPGGVSHLGQKPLCPVR